MTRDERIAALHKAAADRILVLDGAMGTMIQRHKLEEADYRGARFKDWPRDVKGNNDLLVLTQPDIVRGIHEAYLEAGADIVETDTFNAQAISMADYGMEALSYEMNLAAAKLAREAADKYTALTPDKPRFVAGSMGPTNRTASLSPDVSDPGLRNVTFDELAAAYGEQTRGLIEGGADIVLIETIFDTLNAKAAGFAVKETFDAMGFELPIMLSGTIIDLSGRNLSGQTPEAFWYSLRHLKPFSVGLNCSFGATQLRPLYRADRKSGRYARQRLRECRAAERHGRIRRNGGDHGGGACAPGRRTGCSISWAAAAAPHPNISQPSPRRLRRLRRGKSPGG